MIEELRGFLKAIMEFYTKTITGLGPKSTSLQFDCADNLLVHHISIFCEKHK